MYDSEFQENLKQAKILLDQIRCQEDRLIAAGWISRLCKLQSEDIRVSKHRNAFFRYMLRVLQEAARHAAEHGEDSTDSEDGDSRHHRTACHWSPDKTTYTAIKQEGNQVTHVYMAITKDPALGWDVPRKN